MQAILVKDFNKFTYGRWHQKFKPGMKPYQFESCDWQIGHLGKWPRFWQYTKHAACHWLCNFSLELAGRAVPHRPWQIITSDAHSTVWDGHETLFDFNFHALGVTPLECFTLALRDGVVLEPGYYMDVAFADHYTVEMERRAA